METKYAIGFSSERKTCVNLTARLLPNWRSELFNPCESAMVTQNDKAHLCDSLAFQIKRHILQRCCLTH